MTCTAPRSLRRSHQKWNSVRRTACHTSVVQGESASWFLVRLCCIDRLGNMPAHFAQPLGRRHFSGAHANRLLQ
jgi:hypothetical protein